MMFEFTPYEKFLDDVLTELISHTGPKVTIGIMLDKGQYSFSFHYYDWHCYIPSSVINGFFIPKTDPMFEENFETAVYTIRHLAQKEIIKLIYSEDN